MRSWLRRIIHAEVDFKFDARWKPIEPLVMARASDDALLSRHVFGGWKRRAHGEPKLFPGDYDEGLVVRLKRAEETIALLLERLDLERHVEPEQPARASLRERPSPARHP